MQLVWLRQPKVAGPLHKRKYCALTNRVLRAAYWTRQDALVLPAGPAFMQSFGEDYDAPKLSKTVADILHVFAHSLIRDKLVSKGKRSELSAAVVFLPEHTLNFGQHGRDQCYCEAMYGETKPWGCRW